MIRQHKNLSSDRWKQYTLCEQMANIGSEVARALKWRGKNNQAYCDKAVNRSLELIDLSLEISSSFSRTKEIARLREAIVDYFYGTNEFASSEELWRKYFDHFNYASRCNNL